jgi:dihydrodipicolinate synthase/N-acetylneuraminate lyase
MLERRRAVTGVSRTNVPYRTAAPVSARALRELARVPGIAGVKQAVGGIDHDTVALLPAGAEVVRAAMSLLAF